MNIERTGSRPSGKGPAEYFTGTVRIDPLMSPPEPARVAGALVTFEPGARTAWHTHPLGQTLIVTAGCGWVQRQGGPVEEIRPGDVVWFEPGEKHWHGATAITAMTHRHPGEAERLARRLDGARDGRRVRGLAPHPAGTGGGRGVACCRRPAARCTLPAFMACSAFRPLRPSMRRSADRSDQAAPAGDPGSPAGLAGQRARGREGSHRPAEGARAFGKAAGRSLGSLLAALLLGSAASAEEVTGLYSAETIITGTREPELSRGLRLDLTAVAIKLTGDTRLAEDGRLEPLLEDPWRYLDTSELEDRMKGIPVHDEQGSRDRPHRLRATFKAAALDPALAGLGLKSWPADRPRILVFLGIETATGRYLLQQSGPQGYGQRAVLVETAAQLGLPVAFPAGDPPAAQIAALPDGAIRPDGLKPGDAVLSGLLSLAEGGYWNISWRLSRPGERNEWSMHNVTFDVAIRRGLSMTALVLSGNAPR